MKFQLRPFFVPKRKLFELVLLMIFDLVIYVIWDSWEVLSLFSFGFVWNWVASQPLTTLLDNRRYRFSTVKLVINLQNMILKPLTTFPWWIKSLAATLPAGIFWSLVIFFNDAHMPWWATFLGSLAFELVQWEGRVFEKAEQV